MAERGKPSKSLLETRGPARRLRRAAENLVELDFGTKHRNLDLTVGVQAHVDHARGGEGKQ